ncbi:two-component system sensor histidine kinase YesM [Aequitasia blattaphilus]
MAKGPKSIQSILKSTLLVSMVFLIVLFTCVFSLMEYTSQKNFLESEMQRTCNAIAKDIDLQLQQLDTVCLNTINSTSMKDSFSNYMNSADSSSYEISLFRNELSNVLISIRGVDTSIRQINVFNTDGEGFGAGNYTGSLQTNVDKLPWFDAATKAQGLRYYPGARKNQIYSEGVGTNENRYYFSLVRMFYGDYHTPKGYVEVLKYYDILFHRAYEPETNYPINVTIYDENKKIVFPLDPSKEQEDCQLYYATTDYSDLTVVTAIPSREFFSTIYQKLLPILIILISGVAACYFISKILSKRLSAPIKNIYRQLQRPEFNEHFEEIALEDSHIIEIEKLKNALNDSLTFRQESMNSMMLLKEQELQAQMLAFQSQMNPHFLYNSLNTISAMIEEGLYPETIQMSRDITSILRYISSNKEQTSSLEEELEHCELYLKCIKLRYADILSYSFHVCDDILDLQVPKLCIQLLVENACKFTSETLPPWHISIEGEIKDGFWYVDVKDNGPGFDDNTSLRLRKKMDEILANGLLPSLELDGMGILNVFIRLYLLYGIDFVFDFGNLENGGAVVRIGGPYEENQ